MAHRLHTCGRNATALVLALSLSGCLNLGRLLPDSSGAHIKVRRSIEFSITTEVEVSATNTVPRRSGPLLSSPRSN